MVGAHRATTRASGANIQTSGSTRPSGSTLTDASRFVTNLLDGQQAFEHKASMFALAATAGIPASFVSLRHQISHEALPSLPVLRGAARQALAWIWSHYWAALALRKERRQARAGNASSARTAGPRATPSHPRTAAGGERWAQVVEKVLRAADAGRGAPEWIALLAEVEGAKGSGELGELLHAIAEAEDGAEVEARALGRLTRLARLRKEVLLASHRKRADGTGDDGGRVEDDDGGGRMEVDTEAVADIDRAREELRRTRMELEKTQKDDEVHEAEMPPPRGWTRHEGPWRPRPIGELIA